MRSSYIRYNSIQQRDASRVVEIEMAGGDEKPAAICLHFPDCCLPNRFYIKSDYLQNGVEWYWQFVAKDYGVAFFEKGFKLPIAKAFMRQVGEHRVFIHDRG